VSSPEDFQKQADALPADLRALLDAELAAGNQIAEAGRGFPGQPEGTYLKLTGPFTTRPRVWGDGLQFHDYSSFGSSGSFTNHDREFFILEPLLPPEPVPDMDAIREAHNAPQPPPFRPKATDPNSALARFERSMIIDYEKWHDGVGYDIEALKAAKVEQAKATEDLLLDRGIQDWRDVEALVMLDTSQARELVKAAMTNSDPHIRMAVTRYAPELIPDQQRTASLANAIATGKLFGGLSQALDEAAEYHPKEVVDALFRGALHRDGETAVNIAGLLLYLHGKATEPFDWDQRPFFLRFNTENPAERKAVFLELCEKVGVDPSIYL
jgi:hypothetical protein